MIEGAIRFDARALLITGGGRGIGRAVALELAHRGASVVVADNGTALDGTKPSTQPAQAVAGEIEAAGLSAVFCGADLATAQGVAEAVAACMDSFGRIDGIAHIASPCPDLSSPDELDDDEAEKLLAVNPLAALRLAKHAWPHWSRQGYGRFLLTPSAALYGASANAPYAAAKSALIGLTRCLAVDGAAVGVRVNAIMPAARSRMTEHFLGATSSSEFLDQMTPEKVASAAAWLLSENCDISGEAFAVGGGRVAHMTLAEGAGAAELGSAEDVGSAMPQILADTEKFYPRDLAQRSAHVAEIMGGKLAFEIEAHERASKRD
jgi:NAD(P)-dependent dehydrogenase (short-subunit alcohol dehydrogenase family)